MRRRAPRLWSTQAFSDTPSFALDFTSPSAALPFPQLDPEWLLTRLLAKGLEWMQLSVVLPQAQVLKVELPVEDDAMFLVEACDDARELAPSPFGVHTVLLDDGVIDMTSEVERDSVDVRLLYTPYLDTNASQEYRFAVPRQTYLGAWAALASALQRGVGG